MPKVNFYLLKQASEQARNMLACKLAEQQSRQGQRVYVRLGSATQVSEMDELLWSFAPESFVPHALHTDPAAANTAVLLGHDPVPPSATGCVLNLTHEPARTHAGITAIAEFVQNDEAAKARSRTLWNHYKQLGFELQLHQL